MARLSIDYGPPGSRGVQSIMGVGAFEFELPAEKLLNRAAWVSVGVWGLGLILNSKSLRSMGVGGAAVGFGVKYLSKKQEETETTFTAEKPATIAGWSTNPRRRRRRRWR